MESACLCQTVGGDSGKNDMPMELYKNIGKTSQNRKIRVAKKRHRATVIGNPLKLMGKQHFRAMGTNHTSAPSVVRKVEFIGNHWETVRKQVIPCTTTGHQRSGVSDEYMSATVIGKL